MLHYLAGQIVGICLGIVVGAFMPAIGRKIKGLFVKETTSAKSAATSELGAIAKKL